MGKLLTKVKETVSSGLRVIANEDRPPARATSEESLKRGFETKDANTFGVILGISALVAVGILIQLTLGMSFRAYKNKYINLKSQPNQVPDDFQNGSQPTQKLTEYRSQMAHQLSTYGWIDQEKQTVHIPIERAMEILVERGANGK